MPTSNSRYREQESTKPILLQLWTMTSIKPIITDFLNTFGVIWLFGQPLALFWSPVKQGFGWISYGVLVILSLSIAIIRNRPRKVVSRSLSDPDSVIEIKIGDLFEQPSHLVIGSNDVFDTTLEEIIKPSAVQGQFLEKIYSNNKSVLDSEIEAALSEKEVEPKRDNNKKKGKNLRYPIGTTITLGLPERCYFFTAYGYMGNDLKVQSNVEDIWTSLSILWEEIRCKGNGKNVAIPIIGSDLARTNWSRMPLSKLIIHSFVIASKREFVAKKLSLMIYPKDLDKINLRELEDFLALVCL